MQNVTLSASFFEESRVKALSLQKDGETAILLLYQRVCPIGIRRQTGTPPKGTAAICRKQGDRGYSGEGVSRAFHSLMAVTRYVLVGQSCREVSGTLLLGEVSPAAKYCGSPSSKGGKCL